jgi:predicted enzyme related to lactoylglutathione lyase
MVELLVNIDVGDLDAAVRFYTMAFALSIGRRFGSAVVELLGASSAIYLLAKAPGSNPLPDAKATRTYDRHWTPVHLDFVVADIEAATARAEAAGAAREGEIVTHAWGRISILSDPFGNGLCLLEFQGRGYDEIATRGGKHARHA